MRLRDSAQGYGIVSRTLHWSMALLLVLQLTTAALHLLAGESAAAKTVWPLHFQIGFTLWWLVLLRGTWALANYRNRPPHEGSPLQARAATAGHLALYALMVVVPTLALLRAAGRGSGVRLYGIQWLPEGTPEVPALTAAGNLLHGTFGWVLASLVVGHVAFALWHGLVRRDGTLSRMWRGR
ncbi:cytochrome b [Croceibacterium ferulae]|uniref:cytochrome b n=1 Tax=Croceibacterium ferulae TaxID=1854641 RepID=UPI000EAC3423|nr:cytochrome b [Croceibacterium ferulae]